MLLRKFERQKEARDYNLHLCREQEIFISINVCKCWIVHSTGGSGSSTGSMANFLTLGSKHSAISSDFCFSSHYDGFVSISFLY